MAKLKIFMARMIKSRFALACLYFVYYNQKEKLRYRIGSNVTDSGSIHHRLSVEEMVEYSREVFQDYKEYAGVDHFHGRVAEIGPGESCGVSLFLRADGCSQIDLVDRFYSKRDSERLKRVYQKIWDQSLSLQKALKGADLGDESTFSGINRYYGPEAAGETFFKNHVDYDLIVSRSVMEHMEDPLMGLSYMAKALKPGGLMLHKVDFRDHGLFSPYFHELKFLESPRWLHRLMTAGTGGVNRILVNRYREALDKTGLEYQILVALLVKKGEVRPHVAFQDLKPEERDPALAFVAHHRKKFSREFKPLSDEDLASMAVFIVARKPVV